jgi:flagellar FliL protein
MADAKAATAVNEADVGAEAAADQPKSKFALPPLKVLIMGGAAFAVLVGGGLGGYLYFKPKPEPKPDAALVKPVVFVDLPEVVVNLSNAGTDRTQYLKVKIVLELPEQKMIDQIQPIMPRVMDAFQTYLRELRPNDLDGSAGLYRLKEELTRRVNASIAPSRINAVLFKEIVVQ